VADDQAQVSRQTEEAEQAEARAAHRADRGPTPEEEAAAEEAARDGVPPDVAAHEREMTERGANIKGEGQI
jgi:hypothetical protein